MSCKISALLPLSFKHSACPLPAHLSVISDYLCPSASAFSPLRFISPRLLPTRTWLVFLRSSSLGLLLWAVEQKDQGSLVQAVNKTVLHCSFIGGLGALNNHCIFVSQQVPGSLLRMNLTLVKEDYHLLFFLSCWTAWIVHIDYFSFLSVECVLQPQPDPSVSYENGGCFYSFACYLDSSLSLLMSMILKCSNDL